VVFRCQAMPNPSRSARENLFPRAMNSRKLIQLPGQTGIERDVLESSDLSGTPKSWPAAFVLRFA